MHFSTVAIALVIGLASATPVLQRATNSSAAVPAASTQLAGNLNAKPNPTADVGFVGSLLAADSTVARFKILQDAISKGKASLKFDFNPAANPANKPGLGGEVLLANRVNFPMVTGLGISGAALFFAPCGLNTPHTHPRASEFFTVSSNSSILTGFVLENGLVAEQNTTLTQYQGTIFPMGSVHWQQNLACEPAVGLAALSSDDPGASSIAQNFLVNTQEGILEAAIGFPEQITAENYAQLKKGIPTPFVQGMQECFKRCGFAY